MSTATDEFTHWRSAYAAEVEAHAETRNVLDGSRRQVTELAARIAELELDVSSVGAKLVKATKLLAQHGIKPPEEAKHTGEWYSCVVCSTKTDLEWLVARKHVCCRRTVYVGPCCSTALERSRQFVESIMADGGHAPGCRGSVRLQSKRDALTAGQVATTADVIEAYDTIIAKLGALL